ncbi:MAG: glycoside hydrolase family 2 [Gloeobacteraceae cyanobacterium ES-bin-144]|nr:glycoside hydrolase family 2 [Verrucomicrobiales bacterium]
MKKIKLLSLTIFLCAVAFFIYSNWKTPASHEEVVVLSSGWRLQDAAKVSEAAAEISKPGFQAQGWYPATVPGTVLTSLVNNGVYPEPLYGENNRPEKIPETLCRTPYWYRTEFTVPADFAGRKIWLNFDGINYVAEVWVNGKLTGTIKGAFARGVFDISSCVKAGESATLAVKVTPQPHPGDPLEQTITSGVGPNGGITALDGPTFLCSMGWDWIPGIRDRNTGIWQKVYLSASGPVMIHESLVTSDLPLPRTDSADIKVQATLTNITDQAQKGVFKGTYGDVAFEQPVELAAKSSKVVSFDPSTTPQLRLTQPKLWWPNTFGPQNLYQVTLRFEVNGAVSDRKSFNSGVREITYHVEDSENLTVSVNGVRVMCKGGNWGMDEAMKRNPRERLEAQIRMHQIANYTMIRNWVGQSTSEDFYDLCDKYGIMLWDEFFQPNPGDGPNPENLDVYLTNVREKIIRFRNHPSIAIWCGRNEGFPPKEINEGIQKMMDELEPTRLYQPSSTSGKGVNSGGPYFWRTPREYYVFGEAFKTEIGSVSIPTLESVQAMMPEKDWEIINDDWAQHDLARGAQAGDDFQRMIRLRYGKVANLADFVRKSQLANFESYRAMYEGRFAKMFKPCSGVITWMSNPAQPSFVWQLYSHDLEPNSALFAARNACEPIHVMMNESNGHVMVVNNAGTQLSKAKAKLTLYNMDSSVQVNKEWNVDAAASQVTDLGVIEWPQNLSTVHFVKLKLEDTQGKVLSENFYWRGVSGHEDDLKELDTMAVVTLEAKAKKRESGGKFFLDIELNNPTDKIALMTHFQLRRAKSGERVLPVYYSDNYLTLLPHETRKVTIEAATADLKGEKPVVVMDGWNIAVTSSDSLDVEIGLNKNAQVASWPVTGLPSIDEFREPVDQVKVRCGGPAIGDFMADTGFVGARTYTVKNIIDVSAQLAGPQSIYQMERQNTCTFTAPMKPLPATQTYLVRLHFAETQFDKIGTRKFNVDINGTRMLSDFDIFAEAGAKNKALVKELPGIVPDKDGNIRIQFLKGSADKSKINAIEILPSSPAP